MHSCLLIDEILRNIAQRLRTSQDLLNMALSCRSFKEPALDALWSDIASFDNLMECLPYDFIFSSNFIAPDVFTPNHFGGGALIYPVCMIFLKPKHL